MILRLPAVLVCRSSASADGDATGLAEPHQHGEVPPSVQQQHASDDSEAPVQEEDAGHTQDVAVRWVVHSVCRCSIQNPQVGLASF